MTAPSWVTNGQAVTCSGLRLPRTGISDMSTCAQPGWAKPQRGMNGQPCGGSRRSGGLPGIPVSSRRAPCSDGNDRSSPWVYGFLVNNVWSFGTGGGGSYNNFLLQPFVNYNFEGGTYLSSSPILTANWKASGSNVWTVPIGMAVGKIFHLGKLPVNCQIGGYYNVAKPDFGPNWQVRAQIQLMFPK